jgi:hypothetical protein
MHRLSAVPIVSRTASRTSRTSQHGRNDVEVPIAILRVQVISCKDLESKDRNGYSDPYVHPYIPLSLLSFLTDLPLFPALPCIM